MSRLFVFLESAGNFVEKRGSMKSRLIESCEHCNSAGAEIPFDNILDRVTGSDPRATDYILENAGEVSELSAPCSRENAR
jgi:hypothetical protein